MDYEAARGIGTWWKGEQPRGLGIGEGRAPDPHKGKGLPLQFTVEDEEVFTTPWPDPGWPSRFAGPLSNPRSYPD
jgi:hypothetical protein